MVMHPKEHQKIKFQCVEKHGKKPQVTHSYTTQNSLFLESLHTIDVCLPKEDALKISALNS